MLVIGLICDFVLGLLCRASLLQGHASLARVEPPPLSLRLPRSDGLGLVVFANSKTHEIGFNPCRGYYRKSLGPTWSIVGELPEIIFQHLEFLENHPRQGNWRNKEGKHQIILAH